MTMARRLPCCCVAIAALALGACTGPGALSPTTAPANRLVLDGVLRDISPAPDHTVYRRALVLYTYEVRRVLSGDYPHRTIQIYHWAIIDHKPQPGVIGRERRSLYRVVVESFDAYPRLETEDRTETVLDFDLPLFIDVGAGDPLAPLRSPGADRP